MNWFRTNRGVAAWLAFFALACQLTLSFGHVHIGKSGLGTLTADAQTTVDEIGTPTPVQPKDPTGFADDFCAVCANISLASTLILPVIAFVLGPVLFITHVCAWTLTAAAPVSYRHEPFSARGPPDA